MKSICRTVFGKNFRFSLGHSLLDEMLLGFSCILVILYSRLKLRYILRTFLVQGEFTVHQKDVSQ